MCSLNVLVAGFSLSPPPSAYVLGVTTNRFCVVSSFCLILFLCFCPSARLISCAAQSWNKKLPSNTQINNQQIQMSVSVQPLASCFSNQEWLNWVFLQALLMLVFSYIMHHSPVTNWWLVKAYTRQVCLHACKAMISTSILTKSWFLSLNLSIDYFLPESNILCITFKQMCKCVHVLLHNKFNIKFKSPYILCTQTDYSKVIFCYKQTDFSKAIIIFVTQLHFLYAHTNRYIITFYTKLDVNNTFLQFINLK